MNKEKWDKIYNIELMLSSDRYCKIGSITPNTWKDHKKNYLDFIKEIDEATEVYNMENKGNKQ